MTFEAKALHRRSDPSTSREAAQGALNFGGAHEQVIHHALVDYGPMTASEIAKRTDLNSVQVSRRLSAMRDKGMVDLTGETRRNAGNRPERVWGAL